MAKYEIAPRLMTIPISRNGFLLSDVWTDCVKGAGGMEPLNRGCGTNRGVLPVVYLLSKRSICSECSNGLKSCALVAPG